VPKRSRMGCFLPDLQRDDWPREDPKGKPVARVQDS
jgi:hypothetical protein